MEVTQGRRMWHFLEVKDMGFSGVDNFPNHSIIDWVIEVLEGKRNEFFQKEVDMV